MQWRDLIVVLFFWQVICESTTPTKQPKNCRAVTQEGCEELNQMSYPSPLKKDHKCEDFVKQDRGDQSHVLRIIESGSQKEQQIVGNWTAQDNTHFFYVNGNKVGQEFLLCAIPKTGVRRWQALMARINRVKRRAGGLQDVAQGNPKVYDFDTAEKMRLLTDPEITRIKLVRNPYVRALSAYVDRISENGHFQTVNEGKVPTFDEWIHQLHEQFKQHQRINIHYKTQYEYCWENIGLKFDYVLKVERMNFWYPCFVEHKNLWPFVMRGWKGFNECYFSTEEAPCEGPTQDENGKIIFQKQSGHYRDSFRRLAEAYSNVSTAQKVTEIYINDIVKYNYPFWNEMLEEFNKKFNNN